MGVRLDLENRTLNFWLNGRPQPKRNCSIPKGEYLMLVKMKNLGNTVILNPFTGCKDDSLPNKLLLSTRERNYLVNSYDHKIPAGVIVKSPEVQKDEEKEVP